MINEALNIFSKKMIYLRLAGSFQTFVPSNDYHTMR